MPASSMAAKVVTDRRAWAYAAVWIQCRVRVVCSYTYKRPDSRIKGLVC